MFSISDADDEAKKLIYGILNYDLFRIIDINTELVYNYVNGKLEATGQTCYHVWNRTAACRNCSSKRAVNEKSQIMKLEYLDGEVIMILSTPIVLEGRTYVLELAKKVTNSLIVGTSFSHDNGNVLEIIRDFNELAVRDTFTGLFNKTYIIQELKKNIKAIRHNGGQLAAAIVDIDKFKDINDTYGHSSGDEVIQIIVAYILETVSEKPCWAGRLGGDEFILIFQDCPFDVVQKKCDELEEKVSKHCFVKGERSFTVNISIGARAYSPDCDTEETFIDHVDMEMYRVKRSKKIVS